MPWANSNSRGRFHPLSNRCPPLPPWTCPSGIQSRTKLHKGELSTMSKCRASCVSHAPTLSLILTLYFVPLWCKVNLGISNSPRQEMTGLLLKNQGTFPCLAQFELQGILSDGQYNGLDETVKNSTTSDLITSRHHKARTKPHTSWLLSTQGSPQSCKKHFLATAIKWTEIKQLLSIGSFVDKGVQLMSWIDPFLPWHREWAGLDRNLAFLEWRIQR